MSREKYFKKKWFGLTKEFDLSIVLEISVFEILKVNSKSKCCVLICRLESDRSLELQKGNIYNIKDIKCPLPLK